MRGLCLQLLQEALAEYEEKVQSLNAEVQEMVKNYVRAGCAGEPETHGEAVQSAPEGEQGSAQQLEGKMPVAEASTLMIAGPEPPGAKTAVEIEESKLWEMLPLHFHFKKVYGGSEWS